MSDLVGTTVSHYRILGQIGEGGMGVVYKAEDTKLNNIVALKFLPPELSRDKEAKQRFLNEARAARRLEHPNICTIYDIDETGDGQVFISMPFYEGGTLEEKIEKGPLSLNDAINIVSNIAHALSKAHNEGIIHRDIKPSNIMFTRDGTIKVVDFGLAKVAGVKVTKTGTTMGTLAYMSPEQLRGEQVDHRADIWALAVMLYEMLTGKHPFQAEHEQAVFFKILNELPHPITDVLNEIPSELVRIIKKALEKEPGDRYQDAEGFISDLHNIKGMAKEIKENVDGDGGLRIKRLFLYGISGILLALIVVVIIVLIPKKESNSIAVLPLKNLTEEQAQEYFADGITEALIGALGKIEKLKVISFTSVLQYKDTDKTIPEIANELGVRNIVEGSVQSYGERIRITAQLINASPEHLIWSKPYDREQKEILALISEVTQSIAEEIKVELTAEEQKKLRSTYVVNPDAYRLYLHGRYHWNKRTPESLANSIEFFQQAIGEDSALAPAYSGLADALALFGSLEYGVYPPHEVLPKAKDAALTAIRLDPLLAEGHTSLANIHLFYDWDWEAARREFEKAIDLNPNYATAHHWFANYFVVTGKLDKAREEIKKALNLDPNSLVINTDVGWIYQNSREYDKAIHQIQNTLKLEPDFIQAHLALGFTYCLQKKYEEAIQSFEKAKELSGGYPLAIAALSYCYALAGRNNQALELLNQLKEISLQRYIPALYFALIYMGLGDNDSAFEWIDKALQERSGYLAYFAVDPKVDMLRSDPRFREVLKRIGL